MVSRLVVPSWVLALVAALTIIAFPKSANAFAKNKLCRRSKTAGISIIRASQHRPRLPWCTDR